MNSRLLIVLLVIGVSIDMNEAGWLSRTFNKVKHGVSQAVKKVAPIVKKAAPYAMTAGQILAQNPEIAASLGDEEFMTDLRTLKAADQDTYDQAIESLRSDLASSLTDEDVDDIINDVESLMEMDN